MIMIDDWGRLWKKFRIKKTAGQKEIERQEIKENKVK